MMNKFFRYTLALTTVFYVNIVLASVSIGDIPKLGQEEQHAKVVKRITDLYSRSHYKSVPLDDALSEKIFDRYIKQLDYNRQIFTQKDIDDLSQYKTTLDDSLKATDVSVAYKIYKLNLTRRFERYTFALSLLEKEIKFDVVGEVYQYDRSEAPWAKDTSELDAIWAHKVKSDALSLKLTDKDWPEIKKQLTRRYNLALTRLTQTENEDVFQVFMDAYSHVIEPHTSYLSPRGAERFKMEMNLSLEGIGAVLSFEDDYTVVQSLVKGGPAEKSKQLKKDDKIIGVGQADKKIVDVIGWRAEDVVDKIKGPKGTKVYLQIQSGKNDDVKVIEIIRDKIHLEDREVKSSVEVIKGKNIGVITIPSFYVNLSADIDKAITKLKKEKVKGIVIDLRNNGGGSLLEATLSTGLFIKTGPVVQVRDSRNQIEVQADKNPAVSYSGPLTVLINRYSASASEIFAAALQDYGRAIIIGERSYGKGTVQQHRRIARFYDADADVIGSVQYTIAKFYRINGGSTQNRGVTPDILFPTAINHEETGESLNKNALPWDQIKPAKYKKMNNVSPTVKVLLPNHQKRMKAEVEFSYLAEDIAEYKKEKDDVSISLEESVRIKKREEMDSKLLVRNNERLKRAKLPEVKSLDDIPDDFEPIDSFLIEAAAITLDYSKR